jgi:hypothetical protein
MRIDMQIDNTGGAPASGAEREATTGGNTDAGQDNVVSLIDDDDEVVAEDDAEQDEGDSDETGDDEAKPRKRSRTQRYRDRIARLTAELDAERRQSRPPAGSVRDDDLVEPRQADFPDDYLGYDRAMRDYQVRRALRDERRRDADVRARADATQAFREKLSGYSDRLETLKSRIPDFDQVLRAASGSEIRDDVRDLVLGSAKGPLLAYYLAKHPDALDDINAMPPAEAARKIGNLEARIRGPNPTTATKASAPVTPLRGGASAPRRLDPERMSHEDYRKARAEGRI